MFSIFGSGSCEEVHYCGKYFLRQWRYGGVFPEEVLIFQQQGRTENLFVDIQKRSWRFFFTAARKNRLIFFVVFKSRSAFSVAKRNILHEFFFQMGRGLKLFIVISDQAFSILPMIFFLSCPSWRRYCRGLRRLPELFSFLGKDQRTVTVTKF